MPESKKNDIEISKKRSKIKKNQKLRSKNRSFFYKKNYESIDEKIFQVHLVFVRKYSIVCRSTHDFRLVRQMQKRTSKKKTQKSSSLSSVFLKNIDFKER